MKVILSDFVPHLGVPGDEVDVAPGYARNFLLPKNLAFEATEGNRKTYENNLRQRARKLTRLKTEAEAKKEALEKLEPLIFVRKAGDEGKLFGSVTSADIEAALREHGFAVEKKQIELRQPLKTVCDAVVTVKLHAKVSASVKLSVQGEAPEKSPEELFEEAQAAAELAAAAEDAEAVATAEVATEEEPETPAE